MKDVIICDLDGTLANIEHRLPHLKGQKKNWDAFHKACAYDTPQADVIAILELLRSANCGCANIQNKVYILSGRNDSVRAETEAWLEQHCVFYDALVMRKANDRRHDTEIKLEMVRTLGLEPHRVLCVLDDRQSVVNMWRANGYRCLQVAAWEE